MLDIALIGFPKCATSSLFDWLCQHPAVVPPGNSTKELFFFMDKGHPLSADLNVHSRRPAAYDSFFSSDEDRLRIEGTTHYVFQKSALIHFSDMTPTPVVITVVRDPARRVWSSFQYTRQNLARMDPSLSFAQYVEWALNGEADRVTDYIDHPGSAYVLSRDVEYSAYVKHLRPWQAAVGEGRLVVLDFKSVTVDPLDTCRHIAKGLGIDEKFYDNFEFQPRNMTHRPASRTLQSIAHSVNRRMPDSLLKQWMKQAYKVFATSSVASGPAEEEKRALERLREYYAPYNEQLAESFDVDVSSWT
jgi:hypothetical protein